MNAPIPEIEARDTTVRALVDEPRRGDRVARDWHDDAFLFGVKDVFHVAGLTTRAGSGLPPEVLTGPEGTAVKRLRDAGGIVLGKTVTAEFAFFEPGPTRNPRDPEHTPGGSSSGSAAAVAAGFCPVALGTQTIGSVIRPAAYCGVAGFKPTYGRVPTDGVIACAPSFDTVGWIACDLEWIVRAAEALIDDWRTDVGGATATIGVPIGPYLERAEPRALAEFDTWLERSGLDVRRVPILDDIDDIERRHRRLMFAEMAAVHADWFARYAPLYRPRTAEAIREGTTVPDDEIAAGRSSRGELRIRLESAHVDVWVCPAATGPAPLGVASTGDPIMNLPWTHAGVPVITVPAGSIDGLPIGVQLAGRAGRDEELLAFAATLAV